MGERETNFRWSASADLPPEFCKNSSTPITQDLRGRVLGVLEAARVVGYGRTQMWRDARDGKLPCIIEGTQRHPVYRFRHEDLVAYKQRRDEQRELERLERARRVRRRKQSPAERERILQAVSLVALGDDMLSFFPLSSRQRKG